MGLRQKARRRLESVAGMIAGVPYIISSSIIALDSFSSLSTDWANAFPEQRKRVAIKTDFAMFVRWHLVSNRSTVSPPPGGAPPLLVDGLAKTTFDGNGNLTQLDSVAVSGNVAPGWRLSTGTYSVNRDC